MNGKIFGNSLVKSGFVTFALALGLAACGDGESSNGPSNNHENTNISSVESEDDLPSCTESREGFVRFIDETKEGFICKDRKWVHYDMIADVEENLPGCTGSREGLSAYLYEEDRELNCVEGSWDVVGEVATSSSSEKGDSSSSREKDGSSSSVAPNSSSSVIPGSSSSVILSDSEGSSSSSAKSSSSVASSSSVTSSSSVASSSSSSVPNSSSSVILSSSSEESSNSVASSSSAKSSSSVASSSSIKYGSLIDSRDNQVYKTVTIGTQTWMAENLNYEYNKGTAKSYCYNDETGNCTMYGRLYLWSAAMDSAAVFSTSGKDCGYNKTCSPTGTIRGVCPEGWHLPSKDEWNALFTAVGGSSTAGVKLKSVEGWKYYSASTTGTGICGFSALPAGYRRDNGDFYDVGYNASFWSSTERSSSGVYGMYLSYYYEDARLNGLNKDYARSVRCLKDSF